jgi:hypothetical protein
MATKRRKLTEQGPPFTRQTQLRADVYGVIMTFQIQRDRRSLAQVSLDAYKAFLPYDYPDELSITHGERHQLDFMVASVRENVCPQRLRNALGQYGYTDHIRNIVIGIACLRGNIDLVRYATSTTPYKTKLDHGVLDVIVTETDVTHLKAIESHVEIIPSVYQIVHMIGCNRVPMTKYLISKSPSHVLNVIGTTLIECDFMNGQIHPKSVFDEIPLGGWMFDHTLTYVLPSIIKLFQVSDILNYLPSRVGTAKFQTGLRFMVRECGTILDRDTVCACIKRGCTQSNFLTLLRGLSEPACLEDYRVFASLPCTAAHFQTHTLINKLFDIHTIQ